MRNRFIPRFSMAVVALLLIFSLNSAFAQQDNSAAQFPKKEITLIVPWAAGGGTDIVAREIARLMEKELGKPVVVMNVEGGGGVVGFQKIATSKPDGYTIGFTTNSMLLQKYTASVFVDYKKLKHIAMVNEDPATLTVNANAPWNTISEFVDYAKKNPNKIRVANSGAGAIWHVAAMLLEKKIDTKFIHVPYSGAAPAGIAVAGGHVEATTVSPAEVRSLVDAGKLKMLAIAASQRDPNFPTIPTFKESGIDFVIGVWRAIAAPKDTPVAVIQILEDAITKAVNSSEYKEFMTKGGLGIRYMSSSDMVPFLDAQDADLALVFKK